MIVRIRKSTLTDDDVFELCRGLDVSFDAVGRDGLTLEFTGPAFDLAVLTSRYAHLSATDPAVKP